MGPRSGTVKPSHQNDVLCVFNTKPMLIIDEMKPTIDMLQYEFGKVSFGNSIFGLGSEWKGHYCTISLYTFE